MASPIILPTILFLLAEVAVPQSFSGTPTATVLQNLTDPLEGKLGSINPSDPNSKIIGSAFVYNDRLYLGAFSYLTAPGPSQNRNL